MNKVSEARDFLESVAPGAFERVIEFALSQGGLVHAAADCFLAAVPCEDAPDTLHVVFQCSHLPALRRVLLAMPQYKRVRWRRDVGHGEHYGWRERAVADFCRHKDFGTGLTKDENE